MQKILGYTRKACQEFNLIDNGDKIAVGVSGGKDSLVLLAALAEMRLFFEKKYQLHAISLDPRFYGRDGDYSSVERFCEKLEVPFTLIRSDIYEIVFEIRREKNPCALCAKMRRGALHDAAKENNCNKIALGHNNDDAIETFIMNLFREGRIGCFSPKSYLSRKDLTLIRPLVFAPESKIESCCRQSGFEVIKSPCPVDKATERQRIKEFLETREKEDKGFKQRIFGALRKSGADNWGQG
ncbi:MAG: tRNA 2-thiocytidine biosynthesis TtcA family protein [Oscillospiraceae bacterium]|nr:tRNA 2-thiocytidine biosynthesis TtcA family protein [Oscillospiraceae bacterium]